MAARRQRPTLVIFARAPAIGIGKTRLARDVGAVEAWRIYRAMSSRLIRSLRDPRWRLIIRVAGRRADPLWRADTLEAQGRGDLGARLRSGFRHHAAGPVVVIGTDAPEVAPARIAASLRALRRSGAAIGPALDGGFWLLALSAARARHVRLKAIRWSSDQTLADTVRSLGGDVARLETLQDIDSGADLARWRDSQRSARMSTRRA
jgi:rSAM/selenodomain-associated transferase 1